jgi:cobalt-zinc-cadmium efflux system protein
VTAVHDLHVWTLGAGHDAITAHVHARESDATLAGRLSKKLREAFEVEYVTVQVELDQEACGAPPSRFEEGESEHASHADHHSHGHGHDHHDHDHDHD